MPAGKPPAIWINEQSNNAVRPEIRDRPCLSRLQRFHAIDVDQRAMHGSIGLGIPDDDPRLQQDDCLRMADLMRFPVRERQDEWFERAPVQPFSDRFHIHRSTVPLPILPPYAACNGSIPLMWINEQSTIRSASGYAMAMRLLASATFSG